MEYDHQPVSTHLNHCSTSGETASSTSYSRIFLLLVLLLIRSLSALPAQSPLLPEPEHITDRQGLPQAFVSSIVQDNKGFIWMATMDGFCRYDGDRFRVFQPSSDASQGLSGPDVIKIQNDHDGKLWIETHNHLDLFDPETETFFNLTRQPFYIEHFKKKFPNVTYADRRQRLWLANLHEVAVIDMKTLQIKTYRHEPDNPRSLSHNSISWVTEDRNGIIWISTQKGWINRLDETTDTFTRFRILPDHFSDLDKFIHGMYEQANGTFIMISGRHLTTFDPATAATQSYLIPHAEFASIKTRFATDSKGTTYFTQYGNLYRFSEKEGIATLHQKTTPATSIVGLLIDRSDVLWAGTSGSGVFKYNLAAGAFYSQAYRQGFLTDILRDGIGLPPGQIPTFHPDESGYYFRYAQDRQNRYWFNAGSTPLYRSDPATQQVTKVPFPIPIKTAYPLPPIPMAADPDGRVWVIHDSLALWYDEPLQKWEYFPFPIRITDISNEPEQAWDEPFPLQFVIDTRYLWIASNKKGLYRVDKQTGKMKRYAHNPDDPESISNNLLYCLFADPDDPDILWIGTFGSGLCRFSKSTGKSMVFNTDNGLPNNVIYAAVPDQQGNIWIATNRGLCRMHRQTFEKRIFSRQDGLMADEFNRFHFLTTPDGKISLGGLDGITSFYPEHLVDDTYQPEVEITGIRVNNIPVNPTNSSLTDSLPLQLLREIKLKHDENFLVIEFAGLQYNSYKNLKYRYKLEGLDQKWNDVERAEAVYTNLSPGRYTLQLNSANTAGVWSPHVRTLSIIISPPWWASWWAYIIYFIIALYIGYALIRLYLKEKETEQLHILDELKTRFFSNITHDFRTPLTLILGPAQQLRTLTADHTNAGRSLGYIDVIERNATQLLHLVNQLLDLSKVESNAMQVEAARGKLVPFIQHLLTSFRAQAEKQQIQLTFHQSNIADEQEHVFDGGKLERILYNLISNALKFTDKGGKADIFLAQADHGVTLTVQDTGCGIQARKLPNIFDRFYQIDAAHNFQQQGSGIGLALVKELVELQQGRIEVSSHVESGTTFHIFLPYRLAESADLKLKETEAVHTLLQKSGRNNESLQQPGILIVEDNQELATFIAECLPASYVTTLAGNGEEAFNSALTVFPDLIISDVMMPVMDGYTLCKKIKEDLRTSHIPVILLTAKISHESKITGLTYGADDYLTKPFHYEELQLKVQNVLENMKRQREWIRSQIALPETRLLEEASEKINPFLQKFFGLLEEHLDDTSFGIEDMIAELGMSRMTLFRKIKTLTGYSTSDLIRNYRLNRAAELLKEGITISETAYKVGFNSLAYFSKCFKDLYQMTPSEFIQKHR